MKKKTFYLIVWLPMLAFFIWRGFDSAWSVGSWIGLGLCLFAGIYSWFCFGWQVRIARSITSLSPDERERRLAAMSPERRKDVLQWIKNDDA